MSTVKEARAEEEGVEEVDEEGEKEGGGGEKKKEVGTSAVGKSGNATPKKKKENVPREEKGRGSEQVEKKSLILAQGEDFGNRNGEIDGGEKEGRARGRRKEKEGSAGAVSLYARKRVLDWLAVEWFKLCHDTDEVRIVVGSRGR